MFKIYYILNIHVTIIMKNILLHYFHTYSCKSLKYNFPVKQHFVHVYVYLVHADKLIKPNNTTHKTNTRCQMLPGNCFNTVSTYSHVHRKKGLTFLSQLHSWNPSWDQFSSVFLLLLLLLQSTPVIKQINKALMRVALISK